MSFATYLQTANKQKINKAFTANLWLPTFLATNSTTKPPLRIFSFLASRSPGAGRPLPPMQPFCSYARLVVLRSALRGLSCVRLGFGQELASWWEVGSSGGIPWVSPVRDRKGRREDGARKWLQGWGNNSDSPPAA